MVVAFINAVITEANFSCKLLIVLLSRIFHVVHARESKNPKELTVRFGEILEVLFFSYLLSVRFYIQGGPKKPHTILMSVSLLNIDRFS